MTATRGHRGSAFNDSFNEAHVLAISQAICQHRRASGIDGPLFIGIDTHALSKPALETALQVFIANGVDTFVDADGGPTPTPVISHAILTYNRGRTSGSADGIVLSPSHNPPEDGGYDEDVVQVPSVSRRAAADGTEIRPERTAHPDDAPALSSPTKPSEPSNRPSTNRLKPTGTSNSRRPSFAATRSMEGHDTRIRGSETTQMNFAE